MFWDIISVAAGGSLGALSRFGIGKIIENNIGLTPTWSVVAANLLGCFLFGILFEVTLKGGLVGNNYRPFLLSGFLGSLTTFSTFTHHSFSMMKSGDWVNAGANIVFQVVAGLFLIWVGSRIVEGV